MSCLKENKITVWKHEPRKGSVCLKIHDFIGWMVILLDTYRREMVKKSFFNMKLNAHMYTDINQWKVSEAKVVGALSFVCCKVLCGMEVDWAVVASSLSLDKNNLFEIFDCVLNFGETIIREINTMRSFLVRP